MSKLYEELKLQLKFADAEDHEQVMADFFEDLETRCDFIVEAYYQAQDKEETR